MARSKGRKRGRGEAKDEPGHYGPGKSEERRSPSPPPKERRFLDDRYGPSQGKMPESGEKARHAQKATYPAQMMGLYPMTTPMVLQPIKPGDNMSFPPKLPLPPKLPPPLPPPPPQFRPIPPPLPPMQYPVVPDQAVVIQEEPANTRRPCFRLAATLAISRAACASANEFIQLKSLQGFHDEEDEELFLADDDDDNDDLGHKQQDIVNEKPAQQSDHDDLYGGLDLYDDLAPPPAPDQDDDDALHLSTEAEAPPLENDDPLLDQPTAQQPIVQALTRLENESLLPHLPPPAPPAHLIADVIAACTPG